MVVPSSLTFLLVTKDYHTLSELTEALEEIGARFDFSSTAEAAREYVDRHRLDGVFVDLEVPGARDLILSIRKGMSNRHAPIFACARDRQEFTAPMVAGATVVLPLPLTAEGVISHVSLLRDSMVRERRRYFRHRAHFRAVLTTNGMEHSAIISNLSEGGMAADLVKPVDQLGLVDFVLDMPGGQRIAGKGFIAWANSDGMAGIMFHFLRGQGEETLQDWLRKQEAAPPKERASATAGPCSGD